MDSEVPGVGRARGGDSIRGWYFQRTNYVHFAPVLGHYLSYQSTLPDFYPRDVYSGKDELCVFCIDFFVDFDYIFD